MTWDEQLEAIADEPCLCSAGDVCRACRASGVLNEISQIGNEVLDELT